MIYLIKLINGDEVIGDIVEEQENTITVSNPLQIETVFNENTGTDHLMMSMYMPLGKIQEPLKYNKWHILQMVPARDQVIRYYYNSLEYNSKLSESIENTINHTNNTMESRENFSNNEQVYIHSASKTVH